MTRLDAAAYLDHLGSTGTPIDSPGATVLLALHPAALARRSRTQRAPYGSVQRPRRGIPIATVQPHGPGPAVAAMAVDLLAASGVEAIVGVGIASLLDHGGSPVPRAVVIDSAVADESVSPRYGGHPHADPALTSRLDDTVDNSVRGAAFSTAVPFRVDRTAALASGATVIDMEAAALFAAAHTCGIAAALVVVPSDLTGADHWKALDPTPVAETVGAIANRIRSTIVEEG